MDKQQLKQYRYIIQEIQQLEAEKQSLYNVSATRYSDMPKTKGCTDISSIVQKIASQQSLIDYKLNLLIDLRQAIEDGISDLQPAERMLMRARYIEGKTWEQVAEELHYSYQWVCKLHGAILEKMKVNS